MEAIAEATSARTLGQLENYFLSYGDLPREIILKHDFSRRPLVHRRCARTRFPSAGEIMPLFSYDLMAMKDMKRKEHRKIPEWFTIRRGLYGLRPVSIQTSLDSSSPYVIDVVDGQPKLLLNGKEICEVYFPSR